MTISPADDANIKDVSIHNESILDANVLETARITRLLNAILWASLAITLVASIGLVWVLRDLLISGVVFSLLVTEIICLYLNSIGKVRLAGSIFVITSWIVFTIPIFLLGGFRSTLVFFPFTSLVISGLILSRRTTLIVLIATLISYTAIMIAQVTNSLPAPVTTTTPVTQWISLTGLFILIFVLIDMATNSLRSSVYEARTSQAELLQTNRQLETLSHQLEARVEERTIALEQRAAQLQTSAEVVRILAAERDQETLLNQIVHLISERFDYYHVGVFLVDPQNPATLVLRAANSPGGQRMITRGHRLTIPSADLFAENQQDETSRLESSTGGKAAPPTGIVGKAAAARQPRIAMQVDQDSEFYNNPDLPETRSEMALPLTTQSVSSASFTPGARVLLGVLDVQSTRIDAFSQEDINLLQILADQIAVAIENAQLFAQNQQAVQTLQKAYSEASGQAWEKLLQSRRAPAVLAQRGGTELQTQFFSQAADQPLSEAGPQQAGPQQANQVRVTQPGSQWQPAMAQAFSSAELVQSAGRLAIPVKIRGQVIGAIELRKAYKPAAAGQQPGVSNPEAHPSRESQRSSRAGQTQPDGSQTQPMYWTQDEIEFLQTLNEQLGVALESARLYEETRKRAERERLTGQITARMRASNDPNEILQTAVGELRKALRVTHAQAIRTQQTPPQTNTPLKTEAESTDQPAGHPTGNSTPHGWPSGGPAVDPNIGSER
jgi:GAF domain-containing protein